jgi:hypothetical protein
MLVRLARRGFLCAAIGLYACGGDGVAPAAHEAPVEGALLGVPAGRADRGSRHGSGHANQRLEGLFQPIRPGGRRFERGELRELQRRQQAAGELAAARSLPAARARDGARALTLDQLAGFELTVPASIPALLRPEALGVPAEILALAGERVVLSGYMYALDFDDGGTRHFILARSGPSCFYCQEPALHEWVEVVCVGGAVPIHTERPVVVVGPLTIEPVVAGDAIERLYLLEAERVEPLDAP